MTAVEGRGRWSSPVPRATGDAPSGRRGGLVPPAAAASVEHGAGERPDAPELCLLHSEYSFGQASLH